MSATCLLRDLLQSQVPSDTCLMSTESTALSRAEFEPGIFFFTSLQSHIGKGLGHNPKPSYSPCGVEGHLYKSCRDTVGHSIVAHRLI